jgi:mono/diheme cytochrome c family protein
MLWRFYTVPGNPADGFENPQMELAAKTWSGKWWEMGGGGTAWDSFAYDAELDLLYIGVGNGAPHNREMRSPGGGDNLYLSSIVAVAATTGEYVWHYQQTPADSWDFTATQSLILTEIEWQGQTRQVIMQAPKNGFFFILDRITGELLSAEPYVPVTWATHYDMTTGRPVEAEGAGYVDQPFNLKPTGLGGHNWHPMAYSPNTGLVYIPALDFMAPIENQDEYIFNPRQWNLGYKTNPSPFGHIITQAIMRASVDSYLLAWDPVSQKEVWRAPNPIIGNGGVLATAGNLVFQGNSANQLVAFDATKGEPIWQFDAQQGIMASPITYAVDGEQYVAVLAGRGGGLSMMIGMEMPPSSTIRRLLVFKLGANGALPLFDDVAARVAPPARMDATDDELMAGGAKYMALCARCHGAMLVSDGSVPDLRRLDNIWYQKFDDVVLGGMMQGAGMPSFKADLTPAEARNIKAYVLHKANEDWEIHNSPQWWLELQTWLAEILARFLVFLMQYS